MLTNAEIKRIKSLKDKKFRDEYGQFSVEGEKLSAPVSGCPLFTGPRR